MSWSLDLAKLRPVHKYWVTVGGERGAELLKAVGTLCLPVEAPYPACIRVTAVGEMEAYFLERRLIEQEVMDRLIAWVSQKWNMPQDHVLARVESAGFPIRSLDTVLTVLP